MDKELLDLGASVNFILFTIYHALGLSKLEKINMKVQLDDHFIKIRKGVLEDLLIKVGDYIFLVNFVVLETQHITNPKNQIPTILGRSSCYIQCLNHFWEHYH